MSDRRLVAAVLLLTLYGWALVTATESRYLTIQPERVVQVIYREAPPEEEHVKPKGETPILDSLIDEEEAYRQGDCLWSLLRYWEIDILLDNVLIAGAWADLHGGPCAMMEEYGLEPDY